MSQMRRLLTNKRRELEDGVRLEGKVHQTLDWGSLSDH